jgi:hypothetical protein
MLRYILGYSPSRRLLARLSMQASARLGRALALASALAWAALIRYVFLPMMLPSAATGIRVPEWLLVAGILSILPDFLYRRALAERDLEARINTDRGIGRRWRWALVLQFWGVWAYWLVAVHQLPEPREFLESVPHDSA